MNRDTIINEILIPSLRRLYKVDYVNIKYGVSERNICARLAHHMENIMRQYNRRHKCKVFNNYYADVEYNRMGNGDFKHYENSKKRPQYMVADLLIQSRGEPENLLAVEMKRKGNNRHVKEDKERLEKLVSTTPPESDDCVFGTLVGAFITYSKDDVSICQFEDKEGHGQQVGEIQLRYDETMCQLVFKWAVRYPL